MSPAIVLVALLATFATMIWYGNTLLTRAYHKTMFAGFLASVTQWLLFLAIGYNPVNAIFCTAVIFIAMVTAWFFVEWKCTPAKRKTKDWKPSNAFWVYFLGGMISALGACQIFV